MFGMLLMSGISKNPRCVTSFMPAIVPIKTGITAGFPLMHKSWDN